VEVLIISLTQVLLRLAVTYSYLQNQLQVLKQLRLKVFLHYQQELQWRVMRQPNLDLL
jgi:hypothetical protein